jgi:hypothetical protein
VQRMSFLDTGSLTAYLSFIQFHLACRPCRWKVSFKGVLVAHQAHRKLLQARIDSGRAGRVSVEDIGPAALAQVTESGTPLHASHGVSQAQQVDDSVTAEIGSGNYVFESNY